MWQVVIYTTDQNVPAIEEVLSEMPILSLSMQNAGEDVLIEQILNERPLWSFVKVEVLVETEDDAKNMTASLLDFDPSLQIETEEIQEKNWLIYGLKDFKPMQFANRLWVYPHWLVPDNPSPQSIILDPGFAFGTGQHETTKMCLEWLASHDIQNQTLIDYGCGSGILALAAIKLGVSEAYGIDIDIQACEASIQNAKLNDVSLEQFHVTCNPDDLPEKTDIIIANIVMNPLLEFRDTFVKLLKKDGQLVLSGLLVTQLEQVKSHYAKYFKLMEEKHDLDWGCLSFELR